LVLSKRLRFKNKKNKYFRKKRKIDLKKGLVLLPNLFSLGNAFFGFCSIVFTANSEFGAAAYFILLGALMDMLDGRIARLFGASSEMGIQLDSFADSISFCFAPAFLVYFWLLKQFGLIGLIVSSLFFLAGILRLARFNLIVQQQFFFFLGLPTTIAGCFLVTLFLNLQNISKNIFVLFGFLFTEIILAGLMISKVKFPTFKQKLFHLNRNRSKVAFIILFAIIAVMQFKKFLLILFILYLSSAIFFALKVKE